jgi:alpha-amylase
VVPTDLYGVSYEDIGSDGETHKVEMPVIDKLDRLMIARQRFAHGVQTLWFDHPYCIAFRRSGTEDEPGCVVIMSNGDYGEKMLKLIKKLAL